MLGLGLIYFIPFSLQTSWVWGSLCLWKKGKLRCAGERRGAVGLTVLIQSRVWGFFTFPAFSSQKCYTYPLFPHSFSPSLVFPKGTSCWRKTQLNCPPVLYPSEGGIWPQNGAFGAAWGLLAASANYFLSEGRKWKGDKMHWCKTALFPNTGIRERELLISEATKPFPSSWWRGGCR